MEPPLLPPLPVGLISAAARYWARRAVQFPVAAQLRLHSWPAAVVVAAVSTGWLGNAVDWGHGDARFLVAMCLGSLVATAALTAGWATEPDELERWALRALGAAFAATAPILASGGW
jgi:hypothetical protein